MEAAKERMERSPVPTRRPGTAGWNPVEDRRAEEASDDPTRMVNAQALLSSGIVLSSREGYGSIDQWSDGSSQFSRVGLKMERRRTAQAATRREGCPGHARPGLPVMCQYHPLQTTR